MYFIPYGEVVANPSRETSPQHQPPTLSLSHAHPQVRKVALCDFLTRRFLEAARQDGADQKAGGGGWGGAKGGEITIDEPGQHILERSSVVVHEADGSVEARFTVGMPARGESCAFVVFYIFVCGWFYSELIDLAHQGEPAECEETNISYF